MRRALGTVLALVLSASMAACGDEPEGDWPVQAAAALELEGMLWASGSTVGDLSGPLFDVDPAPTFFVPAGGGIYFGSRPGRLFYADGETVTAVPRDAVPETLRASADGRWLAFIDEAPHPDEAVVIDTRTRTEILRTSKGMKTGTGPDDLYPDGQHPDIAMVGADVVWIRADDAVLKFTPESRELDEGPFDFEGRDDEGPDGWVQPWFVDRRGIPSGQGSWNASRTWYVTFQRPGTFVAEDGRTVTPTSQGLSKDLDLRGWVDDDTAYGYADESLLVCELATFTCSAVPGAKGSHLANGFL